MGNSISSLFYEPFKTKCITKYKDEQRIYVVDKNRDFWVGGFERRLFENISQYAPFREVGN
mgnify:FL=1